MTEPIVEPDLPIVDPHHHFCFLPEAVLVALESQDNLSDRALAPVFRRHARYLFDEYLGDVTSGHNIRATVHIDAGVMYRATGAEDMKSVGEVEFANGIAAMGASGLFGDVKVCAGIVGGVDLSVGAAVEEILIAQIRAGGSRYRGVRSGVVYDEDSTILGAGVGRPHMLREEGFRRGFERLKSLGLLFEAWLFEPQLPDLIDLAREFPDTPIVLNHTGTPMGIGRYAGKRVERFPIWRDNIRTLAGCPRVTVKLGGLGVPYGGFSSYRATPPATALELAQDWRPYIETCIECFGVDRCMFESNYPVDAAVGSYAVLWNAFKHLVSGASPDEKAALFSGTARRVYRLEV